MNKNVIVIHRRNRHNNYPRYPRYPRFPRFPRYHRFPRFPIIRRIIPKTIIVPDGHGGHPEYNPKACPKGKLC